MDDIIQNTNFLEELEEEYSKQMALCRGHQNRKKRYVLEPRTELSSY